jgi:hypothetical protein
MLEREAEGLWWGALELTLEAICDILTECSAFRALPF